MARMRPGSDRLYWVPEPTTTCPSCRGSVYAEPVRIAFAVASGPVVFRIELGRCGSCGATLADLPLLEDVLEQIGASPLELDGFTLNDQAATAAVYTAGAPGPVEWTDYLATLERPGRPELPAAPTAAQARAAPARDETWQVSQRAGALVRDASGPARPSHVALVLTEEGRVRAFSVNDGPLGAPELADLVFRACARPASGEPPARPARLIVGGPPVGPDLDARLRPAGIRAHAGDVPVASAALDDLLEALAPAPVPVILADRPEREVRKFLAAARAFFRARPWEVIDWRPLAFRHEDGPWGYAVVLGQNGEEFGLSLFASWLEHCRLVSNDERFYALDSDEDDHDLPRNVRAAGGVEGLTLGDLDQLAPEDADRLAQLRARPVWIGGWPVIQRFTPDGLAAPRLSLRTYTALLDAIADRASRSRNITSIRTAVHTPAGPIELRYPSRGDEDADRTDYYRLEYDAPDGAPSAMIDPSITGLRVVAHAPGEAKLHRVLTEVTRALKQDGRTFPWPGTFRQGGYDLWVDRAPTKEPSPTIEQIAGLEDVTTYLAFNEWPVMIERVERPADPAIRVELVEHRSD